MGPGLLEETFDHAVQQLVHLTSHLNLVVTDRIHGLSTPLSAQTHPSTATGLHYSAKSQCYSSSSAQRPPPRVIYMPSPFASLSSALTGVGGLGGPMGKDSQARSNRSPSSLQQEEEEAEETESQERILISEVGLHFPPDILPHDHCPLHQSHIRRQAPASHHSSYRYPYMDANMPATHDIELSPACFLMSVMGTSASTTSEHLTT